MITKQSGAGSAGNVTGRSWMRGPLMAPVKDKGGGGGGDPPPDDDDDDAPLVITKKTLAGLLGPIIANTVNVAMTAREKRSAETRKKAEEAAASQKLVDDAAAAEAGAGGALVVDKAAAGGGAAANPDIARLENEVKRANKLAADANSKADKAEAERVAAIAATTRSTERSVLSEALAAGGARKESLPALIALLHTERGKIKTIDGKHVYVGDDDIEVPVAEGVKAYLATDEGKTYLPAKAVGGGGNGATKGGGRGAQGKEAVSDASFVDALTGNFSG